MGAGSGKHCEAGCTNGPAEMAKPNNADIDRMNLLGREPVERVSGVDEGSEMGHKDLRLQKAGLYYKERHQCSRNANKNIPNAHRVLLEGEWTWCVSSEVSNSEGNANAFNTAIEHADSSDKSIETTDTKDIELEGCKGVMSVCKCVDGTDGDPSRGVKPTDTPNESETLITLLIKSEDLCSGGIPCVCLGNHVDESEGQTDEFRGQLDALNASNITETEIIGHGEGASMYLGIGDTNHVILETDGTGTHVDMSTLQTSV